MKRVFMMIAVMAAALTMSANTFTKVTSAPEDWSGQYLIAYDSTATLAMIFNGKDEVNGRVPVATSNGVITADTLDKYLVTIEKMSGGYSVFVQNKLQYIGGKSGENALVFDQSAMLNTISFQGSDLLMTSNTSVLRFNKASNQQRFRYYKSSSYANQKTISLYKAEQGTGPIVITYDTISVTEALARIAAGNEKPCYIKGVVATAPSDPGSYGNTIAWLTDIDNPTDSIKGYKIAGLNGAEIKTIDDIPFELGDTIKVFAQSIISYKESGKSPINEINGGYFVEMLGKTSVIKANSIFKYAVGAIAGEMKDNKYFYEIILSKESEEDSENAVHMVILSANEKGIKGSYTLRASESYINGTPDQPISGSLDIKYIEESGSYIKYSITSTFSTDDVTYKLDTTYIIPGWKNWGTPDVESFKLVDDMPFVPEEGQEITCAQAYDYAINVVAEGQTSPIQVCVTGYANNVEAPSGLEQTFWMDDAANGKKVIESYYGRLSDKQVTAGSKVKLCGYLQHYVDKSGKHIAEIKNGTVEIIEGGEDMKRDVKIEPAPGDYITVAQAIEIAKGLHMAAATGTSDTSATYTIYGYLTKIDSNGDYNTKYKNESFFMDDVPPTDGKRYDLSAYRCTFEAAALVGDRIFVEGRLIKYVGESFTKYQIVNGTGHFVSLTGLEEIMASMPAMKVQKIMHQGHIYIVREGKLYDLRGSRIR
ncbi:MAG: hypothetical protein MJZ75_05905 [Paludibacteraceae bacterium]|nr:hypothetical protein [Paludibacteraceae bacterium]